MIGIGRSQVHIAHANIKRDIGTTPKLSQDSTDMAPIFSTPPQPKRELSLDGLEEALSDIDADSERDLRYASGPPANHRINFRRNQQLLRHRHRHLRRILLLHSYVGDAPRAPRTSTGSSGSNQLARNEWSLNLNDVLGNSLRLREEVGRVKTRRP